MYESKEHKVIEKIVGGLVLLLKETGSLEISENSFEHKRAYEATVDVIFDYEDIIRRAVSDEKFLERLGALVIELGAESTRK